MPVEQPSFTDVEYGNRRRVSRRETFLETMNATIPWAVWVGVIEPHLDMSSLPLVDPVVSTRTQGDQSAQYAEPVSEAMR